MKTTSIALFLLLLCAACGPAKHPGQARKAPDSLAMDSVKEDSLLLNHSEIPDEDDEK